jgi:hypothetical protein
VNRDALEAWLAAHPPQTLLTFADRLIAHPSPARSDEVLAHLDVIIASGAIFHQLTNAMVILAIFKEEGVDVERTTSNLIPHMLLARKLASAWREPERSVYFYWQERAGLGPHVDVGPDPDDPYLRFYHQVHRVFFAGDYGKRITARVEITSCPDDADAYAELLFAEAMFTPRADTSALIEKLSALQLDDGSFPLPTFEAKHHAACVASLAMRLLM